MEKIFFENSFGEKISGVLEMPKHADFCPLVVFCHGFGSNKDNPIMVETASILNNNGIATFRFDFSSQGASGGDFSNATVSRQLDDLYSGFSKIMGFKKIDYSSLGLFGASLGGMTALLAAPKLHLKCLAVIAPVSDFKRVRWKTFFGKTVREWKENGFVAIGSRRLNYSFFEDGCSQDVYSTAKSIRCPTLVVHGEKDSIVPLAQSKKLLGYLECEKRLEIIPEAGHSTLLPKQYRHLIAVTAKWLIVHLK